MADDLDWDGMDEPEIAAASGAMAASALGPLSQRVEGIAGYLVDHPNLHKLTNLFSKGEPPLYAKMTYLEALVEAVGAEDREGFKFPQFKANLLRPDYELRTSVKQQTRKILESITKIFERGGEGGGRRFAFGAGRR